MLRDHDSMEVQITTLFSVWHWKGLPMSLLNILYDERTGNYENITSKFSQHKLQALKLTQISRKMDEVRYLLYEGSNRQNLIKQEVMEMTRKNHTDLSPSTSLFQQVHIVAWRHWLSLLSLPDLKHRNKKISY